MRHLLTSDPGGAGSCNLKSNYEPAPGKSANYVAAIPIVARG